MQRQQYQAFNSAINLKSAKNWFEKCPIGVTKPSSEDGRATASQAVGGRFESARDLKGHPFESCTDANILNLLKINPKKFGREFESRHLYNKR
jgi:hypothetical protein